MQTDAQSIRTPTLFIGGADTTGVLPPCTARWPHMRHGARDPDAGHWMFEQAPLWRVVTSFWRARAITRRPLTRFLIGRLSL